MSTGYHNLFRVNRLPQPLPCQQVTTTFFVSTGYHNPFRVNRLPQPLSCQQVTTTPFVSTGYHNLFRVNRLLYNLFRVNRLPQPLSCPTMLRDNRQSQRFRQVWGRLSIPRLRSLQRFRKMNL